MKIKIGRKNTKASRMIIIEVAPDFDLFRLSHFMALRKPALKAKWRE